MLALLGGAGVSYDTLGGVQPNPHLGLAREGVKKAIAMDAQLILAIGGGSVIDTAKAIAHGRANPDIDIWDFWLGKKKVEKTTPGRRHSHHPCLRQRDERFRRPHRRDHFAEARAQYRL